MSIASFQTLLDVAAECATRHGAQNCPILMARAMALRSVGVATLHSFDFLNVPGHPYSGYRHKLINILLRIHPFVTHDLLERVTNEGCYQRSDQDDAETWKINKDWRGFG